MKYKKTANNPDAKGSPAFIVVMVIIYAFTVIPIVSGVLESFFTPTDNTFDTTFAWFYRIILLIILFLVLAIPIGALIGKLRAKHQIHQDNRTVKLTNPYQYYKELPNNFGIGIASILTDSTIENEKDIIATILDLCAQHYLHLSKHSDHYVIRVLSTNRKPALLNESYILDLIRENKLSQLSYQRWYDLCIDDGIKLGLFQKPKSNFSITINTKSPKRPRKEIPYFMIGAFIITFITGIIGTVLIPNEAEIIFTVAFSILILGAAIELLRWLFNMLTTAHSLIKSTSQETYKSTLEHQLKRTDKGNIELQKLLAFRNFLAQFNAFVDKDPEAVILWDRYLSYAQVFELAPEIMRSGYHQLIDNAAFKIDDINNITLDNLSLSR